MVWDCTVGYGFAEGLLVSGVVRGKPGFVVLSPGSLRQLSGLGTKTSNWKKNPHKISGGMEIQRPPGCPFPPQDLLHLNGGITAAIL